MCDGSVYKLFKNVIKIASHKVDMKIFQLCKFINKKRIWLIVSIGISLKTNSILYFLQYLSIRQLQNI